MSQKAHAFEAVVVDDVHQLSRQATRQLHRAESRLTSASQSASAQLSVRVPGRVRLSYSGAPSSPQSLPASPSPMERSESFIDVAEESNVGESKLGQEARVTTKGTTELFASILAIRSAAPEQHLNLDEAPKSPIPIASIGEDKLLKRIGLTVEERNEIEGLTRSTRTSDATRTSDDLSSRESSTRDSSARESRLLGQRTTTGLAADPPAKVFDLQRRTAMRLVRPFPLGLRFSGSNMSPLPAWLSGAQAVALNMCTGKAVDLPQKVRCSIRHDGLLIRHDGLLVACPYSSYRELR